MPKPTCGSCRKRTAMHRSQLSRTGSHDACASGSQLCLHRRRTHLTHGSVEAVCDLESLLCTQDAGNISHYKAARVLAPNETTACHATCRPSLRIAEARERKQAAAPRCCGRTALRHITGPAGALPARQSPPCAAGSAAPACAGRPVSRRNQQRAPDTAALALLAPARFARTGSPAHDRATPPQGKGPTCASPRRHVALPQNSSTSSTSCDGVGRSAPRLMCQVPKPCGVHTGGGQDELRMQLTPAGQAVWGEQRPGGAPSNSSEAVWAWHTSELRTGYLPRARL